MKKSTPIGLLIGLGLIYGAIFLGTGWQTFFDPASLILVIGGTAAALVVTYSFDDLKQLPGGAKGIFGFEPPAFRERVEQLSELSRTARRDGLLALDRQLSEIEDPFVRFGLELAVDGTEEDEISGLLGRRLSEDAKRGRFVPGFFNNAGMYAPAFGMIGTLIGLIQMLQNLSDPAQIGAGMATAMITTFYGALLANLIFLPIATKAKTQAALALKDKEIIRAGILSIVRGDSPRLLERRLRLYLDPDAEADAAPDADADAAPPLSKAA